MPESMPDPTPDFMTGYGEAEARRAFWIKRIVIGVLTVGIVGGAGYFYFRTWSQERVMNRFVAAVDRQDLDAAYQMFCPPDHPCRYYPLDRFKEDFGAGARYPKIAQAPLQAVEYCGEGVMFSFDYAGAEDPLVLWVQRSDNVISFAPWKQCPGRRLDLRGFFQRFFTDPPKPQAPTP